MGENIMYKKTISHTPRKTNMKHRLHVFLLLFVIFVFIFSFMSCGDAENETDNAASHEIKQYRGTEYAFPDSSYMAREFTPYFDIDSNTLTVYAEHSTTTENDGITVRQREGCFYRFDSDGTIIDTTNITLPDNTRISAGVFHEDAVYYTTYFYDSNNETREYRLNRSARDFSDIVTGEDLFKYFGVYDSPRNLCVDNSGNIYISGQTQIVCVSPDMTVLFSIEPENILYSMARLRDGTVGICSSFGADVGIATIDSTGNISEPLTLTDGTRTLLSVFSDDDMYDFYFADSSVMWGAIYDENGSLVKEPLMEFANSGILNADTVRATQTESCAYPVAAIGDSFLFAAAGSGEDAGLTPYLYSPIDENEIPIQTITVAYAETLPAKTIDRLLVFQKNNPNIRIVTKDYSYSYDDADTAREKLAFDVINGFCTPDIVIGSYNDIAIEQIVKKKLYLDLSPYISTDDTINSDTLFGCIKRAFDDGNGGMWGICSQFAFRTLISTREMLGEYADQTSWNLEEMLDFLESLPDDVEKMPLATKSSSQNQFLCNGYGMFIDTENGVCTFDSPLFKRYLTYLMTLPDDAREARQNSEYLNLSDSEQYFARKNGKVGLEFYLMYGAIYFFEPVCLFGTSDYIPIGFATDGDSGTQIKPAECYVITTFSEYPDICFELIKAFFAPDQNYIEQELYSLKSQMNDVLDSYADKDIIYYFDGRRSFVTHDPENPIDESKLEEPGIIIRFTDEDRERLMSFLDNAGSPIIDQTPTAVTDIVSEEISALFAGQGTVDDCAAKIQSRVSIWLSENAG